MARRAPNLGELRLRRILGVVVLFAFLIFSKLVWYQVIDAPNINKQSLQRRSNSFVVPAIRGNIVDRNGKILATTVMAYDVNIDPTEVAPYNSIVNGQSVTVSVADANAKLSALLGVDVATLQQKESGTSRYAQLAKGVDGQTYLNLTRLDIPWVFPKAVPHRIYPNGALAGNLLGFINSDGQALEGLELSQNKCLAGVDGQETYQQGVDGIRIPGTAEIAVAPKNGGTLKLTIDSDLQYYAQQVMTKYVQSENADWGSAVVINAKTGEILAAAETPTVDPNQYWATSADSRSSRVFRITFEPGSTIKTVTAATAIDQGVATPLTQVLAPQTATILGGYHISDSHVHGLERLTLQGILIESSNTGIIQVGIKVPYATRAAYWAKFGLGARTAVAFPGEASGIVHSTAPDGVSVYTSMFGQAMTVTPIQTAFIYQTFANGGVRLSPKLMDTCTDANGVATASQPPQIATRVLKPSTARTIVDMLENDVSQTGGVGSTAAIPGYRLGGKSGTAQIADPRGGYGTLHAISFIGMAPAEDPQYVLAVTLYKPRNVSNSIGATPPFKAIMEQILRMYRVPPSTSQSPVIPAHW